MTHTLTHSYSSIKLFENCPLRYYKQRITKEVRDEGGEASKHGERVHKALEDRIKGGVPLPPELEKHEPLCRAVESMGGKVEAEKELVLNWDLQPTGWWSDDAWLRSKLDIYVSIGHKAVIMDWKTGRRKPDFFQLEISAVQAFIHNPELRVVNTSFVWLKDGAIDAEIYKRENFAELLRKITDKTKRIEDAVYEDIWPPKPSGLCAYCPAKSNCAFALRR